MLMKKLPYAVDRGLALGAPLGQPLDPVAFRVGAELGAALRNAEAAPGQASVPAIGALVKIEQGSIDAAGAAGAPVDLRHGVAFRVGVRD